MAHLVITIGCEYGAKGNMIGERPIITQDSLSASLRIIVFWT